MTRAVLIVVVLAPWAVPLGAQTAPPAKPAQASGNARDLSSQATDPTAALMSRFPFLKNVLEPMGFTSIPRALQDQLGLELVESEAPYDVVVIDQAERP